MYATVLLFVYPCVTAGKRFLVYLIMHSFNLPTSSSILVIASSVTSAK